MEEVWKDIPGWEKFYQVSNLGRVRSLDRYVPGRWGLDKRKGIVLSPDIRVRYYYVILSRNKQRYHQSIHVLVMMAFRDHIPCRYEKVIDHINNDPLDNRLENLQITTARHNSSKNRGGTSSYVGVCWHKRSKKWRAAICVDGKQKWLGSFKKEEDAAKAYKKELWKIQA